MIRVEGSLPAMKLRKVKSPGLEIAGEDAPKASFERHFEQHWASIYRLLKRMVGDPAEAEDLALEAMYRLYQHQSWLSADANIGGWLL